MKKLIAGAILLGASSMAFAQPGCGVGAMIWKGQSGIAPPRTRCNHQRYLW